MSINKWRKKLEIFVGTEHFWYKTSKIETLKLGKSELLLGKRKVHLGLKAATLVQLLTLRQMITTKIIKVKLYLKVLDYFQLIIEVDRKLPAKV